VDAVISAYENNGMVQDRVAQLIFGSIPAIGKLPFEIPGAYPIGSGLTTKTNGRLKFTLPEEVGISTESLEKIDAIAKNGIEKGAYPGCQVVVALEGKVIYRKSFGKHTYEGNDSVSNSDVYDIASISKIAGSTIGLMRLQTLGKFNLDKTLGTYLPNLVASYPHENFTLREMMAHQAGLPAWIPFYKRTLKNNQLNSSIYSTEKKSGFDVQVAQDIWMKSSYIDSIYKQILTASLGTKKYEYSDLGYYFVKLIIEKLASSAFDQFLMDEVYKPLGLNSIRYQPLKHFPVQRIIPTENDQVFRKQLVHGYVHDPGAAMLGGIGGHAGLFSNATDLAALMQMLLNKGMYAGERVIDPSVVEEYTKAQFPGNRRGAGFDRPNASGGGTCHPLASPQSFGHSGFTGTLAWADPTTGINYVFLSNRVCPSQDNWKLRDMNIRTEIQRVIYEAVKSRKQ
jgi:CubicO group peptidase (beta-lactamase class C family)